MTQAQVATQLSDYPITHGWIRPFQHPRLNTEVNAQTCVRYLRFLQPVTIDHLQLKPLLYGRWVPGVPTHPAHLTVSTLDSDGRHWSLLRDVNLEPNDATTGAGLSQALRIEEMEARLTQGLNITHRIDLGGVYCQVLRVECDREHPYWPNHGECNGGPYNVPFGILNTLTAHGVQPEQPPTVPGYQPPLRVGEMRPRAPRGMRMEQTPHHVQFSGRNLSVGFSLQRPLLRHLGWDVTGDGYAERNRLVISQAQSMGAGFALSGPNLRTFTSNVDPHNWTGVVSVRGNQVHYQELDCGLGIVIDARFTVEPDRVVLELTQTCAQALGAPVLEGEAWRLAWNIGAAMTGAAATPTLRAGRNGEVELPMLWAGDGNGGLGCTRLEGDAETARLQVESQRAYTAVTGGLVLAPRPALDENLTLPAGATRSTWEWRVSNLQPRISARVQKAAGPAIEKHWATLYTCFRPEFGGFSNNAVSTHCHVNQGFPAEVAAFTQKPEHGPDPLSLYRFTVERALMDGGGYGYWRNLYLDSDPILLSGAGRIYQRDQSIDWLRRVEPGLRETTQRVLGTLGAEGLAVCRDLSGNAGSFRWSSNAMDVVGFGHMDAYVNAWTYRGLRNAAALWRALGRDDLAAQCREAADRLRAAFPTYLLNPATGWVAGWRSRDGVLHDAAYLWVNGVALAFGLLDRAVARRALQRLEALRHAVGATSAQYGVPFNLQPIPQSDHMLPRIMTPLAPTFEHYTDGAMAPLAASYYLRALQLYGLKDAAAQISADLEEGFVRGHFSGGVGSGVEFHLWDGTPSGYEGTFVDNFGVMYALAIQRGLFKPTRPEWWPDN
jgi:hypothetical protein